MGRIQDGVNFNQLSSVVVYPKAGIHPSTPLTLWVFWGGGRSVAERLLEGSKMGTSRMAPRTMLDLLWGGPVPLPPEGTAMSLTLTLTP